MVLIYVIPRIVFFYLVDLFVVTFHSDTFLFKYSLTLLQGYSADKPAWAGNCPPVGDGAQGRRCGVAPAAPRRAGLQYSRPGPGKYLQ